MKRPTRPAGAQRAALPRPSDTPLRRAGLWEQTPLPFRRAVAGFAGLGMEVGDKRFSELTTDERARLWTAAHELGTHAARICQACVL